MSSQWINQAVKHKHTHKYAEKLKKKYIFNNSLCLFKFLKSHCSFPFTC